MTSKLFQPFKIGSLELRNRTVMPPMCTRLAAPDGSVTKSLIDYYAERAKGGVGLIIVEYSYIDEKESRAAPCQLGVYSDHLIAGLNELAEAIQVHGAKAALQIAHGGRQTTPDRMGMQPVAPSPIPCKTLKVMPRELTQPEIDEIQDSFAKAAWRAKAAGFDAVEIHGAHGYLICEFLSPYTNKRTDKYGGNPEGRARFALEVVEKVREKVGPDFTVGIRMNGDEHIEDGIKIELAKSYAQMFEKAGVDYLNVSGGMYESMPSNIPPLYYPHNYFIPLAAEVKKAVKIPVVTAGSIVLEDSERILAEGKADLLAFGRALIADPELPKKLERKMFREVIPCIRCNEGCISRFFEAKTIRCAVNATVGREDAYRLKPARKVKRVVVVGGGPAGMEAARVAALRGHKVTLYESDRTLGGHLNPGTAPDFKADVKKLQVWLMDQVKKHKVKVILKTEVTPRTLKKTKQDVIIIATGSRTLIPNIPGVKKPIVTTAIDVLLKKRKAGKHAAVVGGGLVGCETALHLAKGGTRVTLVEMLTDVAMDMEPLSRIALLEKLSEAEVKVETCMKLEEVADDGIYGSKNGQRQMVKADTVVLAPGLTPNSGVVKALKGLAPEVYAVGDCIEPRKIYHAMNDAYRIANQI